MVCTAKLTATSTEQTGEPLQQLPKHFAPSLGYLRSKNRYLFPHLRSHAFALQASCDDNTAGNGKCDSYNNYDSCAKQYDGGDCCASTCIAGSAGACKGVNATSCNVPGANVCRSIGCSGDLGVLQQAPEFVRHLPCCLGSNNATTVISIIIPPFPFTSLRVGDEVQLNWTCHGCAQTDKVNIDLMRSVKSSGEEFLRTIRTDLFALAGAAVIQVQDVKSNTVIDFGQGDMFFYRIGLARNASIFNDTSQFSIEGGENRVTTEGLTAFAIIAIIVGAIVVFCSVNVILKSFSYKQ